MLVLMGAHSTPTTLRCELPPLGRGLPAQAVNLSSSWLTEAAVNCAEGTCVGVHSASLAPCATVQCCSAAVWDVVACSSIGDGPHTRHAAAAATACVPACCLSIVFPALPLLRTASTWAIDLRLQVDSATDRRGRLRSVILTPCFVRCALPVVAPGGTTRSQRRGLVVGTQTLDA